MAQFDIHTISIAEIAFETATISSAGTTAGEVIDMQDVQALELILMSGAMSGTASTLAPKIQHFDNIDESDIEDVPSNYLVGTITEATFELPTDSNKVKAIGYVGKKRYVKISIIVAGSTPSAVISVVALKQHISNV